MSATSNPFEGETFFQGAVKTVRGFVILGFVAVLVSLGLTGLLINLAIIALLKYVGA